MMGTIGAIAHREWNAFVSSSWGYWVMASMLFLHGLWFHVVVMRGEQTSYEVLEGFFFHSSGFIAAMGVFASMRLLAEEKQNGTLVLLETSPASEWQIVTGKFFGAWGFLCAYLFLTTYMPLLIAVNGHVQIGHVFAGYLGLLGLGGAVVAIGTFASSLASNQLLAAVLGGVLTMALFMAWMVARKVDGPLGTFVGQLDLMDQHYRSFSRGAVQLSSLVYFASLIYAALWGATTALAARRWRG